MLEIALRVSHTLNLPQKGYDSRKGIIQTAEDHGS